MNETSSGPKHLLLSFSGIDGAGKSTQIRLLQQTLQLEGFRADLLTFWNDVAVLKSFREEIAHKVFKGDRGEGSTQAPISRRDKNVRSPLLTLFRMAIYTFDALALRLVIKKKLRKIPNGAGVIIFDRYLHDELANLDLEGKLTRFYISALLRLVPQPNAAFVLDANPAAAFARKPEYPQEFLRSNREAYLKLSKIAAMTLIPPLSIDHAQAEILRNVRQSLDSLLPESLQQDMEIRRSSLKGKPD